MAWVKWEVMCRSKQNGGVGIKNLESFNLSLIGNWAWRLLGGNNALWGKVVRSKYGEFSKVVRGCRVGKPWGVGWSSWWRDVVKWVGCKNGFWEEIRRVVGDGGSTLFWEDYWAVDGMSLKELFPTLYSLEVKKDCLVAERLVWVDNVLSGNWEWRRGLFVWELDLIPNLFNVVNRFAPGQSQPDGWSWKLAKDAVYSTKSGYENLENDSLGGEVQNLEWTKAVWNKWTPMKVKAFVWKL